MTSNGTRLLALVLGFWLVMRSINRDSSGRTLIDHLLGQSGGANQVLPAAATVPAGSGARQGVGGSGHVRGFAGGADASANPFPGATGSRLDQGFDLTTRQLLAPADSEIVYSTPSDPGWRGGGYIAGRILSGPNAGKVWFMAEGLTPTVPSGGRVSAGQSIALPALNPYNSVIGNIEAGWANPANPRQPLAQVVANKPSVAYSFYNWIRSLGGPLATNTAGAGFP